MRVRPLAVEQRPAELALEKLDRPRQRRLRDVAALRGAREIQFLGDGEEVANLVHLHRLAPRAPGMAIAWRYKTDPDRHFNAPRHFVILLPVPRSPDGAGQETRTMIDPVKMQQLRRGLAGAALAATSPFSPRRRAPASARPTRPRPAFARRAR